MVPTQRIVPYIVIEAIGNVAQRSARSHERDSPGPFRFPLFSLSLSFLIHLSFYIHHWIL